MEDVRKVLSFLSSVYIFMEKHETPVDINNCTRWPDISTWWRTVRQLLKADREALYLMLHRQWRYRPRYSISIS